uniref:G-patch domain-containing protein n=1 Tax=Parastrongyloides trichosuri TaxID=131310 RepID=A0A0N4Z150_PARTI
MSESEEEAISFDISSMDYEDAMDGADRKRRFNMTKEDHIYGVFKPDGIDEYIGSKNKKYEAEKKNLSKPINFVSGGTTLNENVPEEFEISEVVKKPKQSFPEEIAGMRDTMTSKISKGSVIMNIMKKMGYDESKGLGKNKQGSVQSIEVNVRPGRAALGSYDFESKQLGDKKENGKIKEVPNKPIKHGEWKKGAKKNEVKVSYEHYFDIKKVDPTKNNAIKIIDMSGKHTKVYDSVQSLLNAKNSIVDEFDGICSKFNVPELINDLNICSSLAEIQIEKDGREYIEKKILLERFDNDYNEIQKNIKELEVQINSINKLVQMITDLKKMNFNDINKICDFITNMYNSVENTSENLSIISDVVVAKIFPFYSRKYSRWNAFENQMNDMNTKEDFLIWKDILQKIDKRKLVPENYKTFKKISDLPIYDRIIYESLHVPIRRTILSWKPKEEYNFLSTFFIQYYEVIPEWLNEYIKIRFIVPKIESEIEGWNPQTDHIPIHEWFLPINDVMGKHLKHIHYMIRNKVAKNLQSWDGSKFSPLLFLKPWKGVFSQKSFNDFIKKNIIPKLHNYLSSLKFSFSMNFSKIEKFFRWNEIISIHEINDLFITSFFPNVYLFVNSKSSTSMEDLRALAIFYINIRKTLPNEFVFQPEIMKKLGQILNDIKMKSKNILN